MPRYRIRYSKEGAARYISHLDMLRTFERAVRRAGLPVSFSQGFNPHPRFSFGLPLSVGVSGLSEYVDVDLDVALPPDEVASALKGAMPPGIRVSGARPVEDGSQSLMAATDRSLYRVKMDGECFPPGAEKLNACLGEIMKSKELVVTRRKKDGREVPFDIRPGLLSLAARDEKGGVVLELELMTSSSLNIRTREVLAAIGSRCAGFDRDCHQEITRVRMEGPGGSPLF